MKIFKKLCYCIFFLLNFAQVNAAVIVVQKQNLDSLLVWAANSKFEISKRLEYANIALKILKTTPTYGAFTNNCVQLSNVFLSLSKEGNYLDVADLLLKKSTAINDTEGIVWGNYLKGTYYYNKTEYDSAFYYLSKAEKADIIPDYKFLLGFVLSTKAEILNMKKDYINAEINSIKALKIGITEKNNVLIYNCYISLGNSLLGLNDKEKALFHYKKATEKADELITEPQYLAFKAQAYNYVVNTYIEKKEYQNAINNATEALSFEELKEINLEIYCALENKLAYANFKLNKSSSEKEFLETLKIADSIKSIPIQLFSKMHLAEYYLKNKNLLKALQYGSEARTQAHKATFFEEELKLLLLLSEIDAKNSTVYTRRYIELNDSLHNVERATRNKYTRIEFETEEITAAKDNAEEQNTFLENRIWMISILSFLTVFIIGLWFINKSQKSKTRQLLLEQKQQQADEEIYQLMLNQQEKIEEGKSIEKQRISLELHDNVMGKMAAIRMNLYPLIMTSELENKDLFYKQLDDMQQVEKEIRGVAHDLNTNLFADEVSFIAVVKEFFEKVKNYTTINFQLQVGETIDWELISTTTKINLYRILQEALQNIEKYADAKNVTVTMSQIDNLIYVLIEDDGKGFDTTSKKEGIGLQNMKTRMDEMHGKFSIQSAPEKGTKISLIIAV